MKYIISKDQYRRVLLKFLNSFIKGFTCKQAGGDDECDNNLYGFKLLNDRGVEKYKYNYYFPLIMVFFVLCYIY